jgi:hypothetical protein
MVQAAIVAQVGTNVKPAAAFPAGRVHPNCLGNLSKCLEPVSRPLQLIQGGSNLEMVANLTENSAQIRIRLAYTQKQDVVLARMSSRFEGADGSETDRQCG